MSSPQCLADLNLPYNFVKACKEATKFGCLPDEIARCLKVNVKFVHEALEDYDPSDSSVQSPAVQLPAESSEPSPTNIDEDATALINDLINQGASAENIAEITGKSISEITTTMLLTDLFRVPGANKLSKEEIDLIKDLHIQKADHDTIMDISGKSIDEINFAIHNFIAMPLNVPEADFWQILKLKHEKHSPEEVASLTGKNVAEVTTIFEYINQEGGAKSISEEDRLSIVNRGKQGHSAELIAETTGINIAIIEYVVGLAERNDRLLLIIDLIMQGVTAEDISTIARASDSEIQSVFKVVRQIQAARGGLQPNTSTITSGGLDPSALSRNEYSLPSTRELTYANGDVYTGSFSGEKKHGRGRLRTAGGEEYNGDFVDDKKHGQGRFTLNNGTYFEGRFVDDKFLGTGKSVYEGVHTYEGTFKGWMRHGRGKFIHADRRSFEGEFVDDKLEEGKLTYQNGDVYSGTFKNWKRHGVGVLELTTGSSYAGEFREDSIQGEGDLTEDGVDYSGYFVSNIKHGGVKIFADGAEVKGEGARNPGWSLASDFQRRQV
jgi:hypothetical protein